MRKRTAALGILLFVATIGWLWGCADRRAPSKSDIQAHPAEWLEPTSVDFHGARVKAEGPDFCEACHGGDLRGMGEATSCYECHDGPGGHPVGWVSPAPPFHGDTVAEEGPTPCQACHGADYHGGWSDVSCYECHAGPGGHPNGWTAPGEPTFHGIVVINQGTDGCKRCHGQDLKGGTSGLGCDAPGCHG